MTHKNRLRLTVIGTLTYISIPIIIKDPVLILLACHIIYFRKQKNYHKFKV